MASGELQAATGAVQAGKDRLMGGVGDWFGATDQAMKDVLGMFTGGVPMGGGGGGMSPNPDYDPNFNTSGTGTLADGTKYTVS